jgi:oxygen-independent coproporphyrinogen-3 oxidase
MRKCPYCDFNSHTFTGPLPEKKYIEALLTDLEMELPSVWGRDVSTVFIGGGTPSLFSAEAIDQFISGIRARLNLRPGIEITMEANPGTVERARLSEFHEAGINRLSLGVQSFDDIALQKLGRIHNAAEARLAIETAISAGFNSINLDLMYGLPGQTVAQAIQDIETAISYKPQHISHYQLTIEPDTAFYRRPPALPDDERSWLMYSRCRQHLENSNYRQYEVSAWSLSGQQCRHNLNYWHFGDYLGIGAGAHQKLTMMQQQQIRRRRKHRLPVDYINDVDKQRHIAGDSCVAENEIAFEFMLNALRLTDGFPVELFYRHTGLPINVAETGLRLAEEKALIERSATWIRPTESGKQYLNELLLLFMTEK